MASPTATPSRRKHTNLTIRTIDTTMKSSNTKTHSPYFPPAPPPSPTSSLTLTDLSLGLPILDFADCDLLYDTLPERFIPDMAYPLSNGCNMVPRAPPPTPARKLSCVTPDSWTNEELEHLMLACESGVELDWEEVADLIPGRSASSCERRYNEMRSIPVSPSASSSSNLDLDFDLELNTPISPVDDDEEEEGGLRIKLPTYAAESDLLYALLSSPPPLSRGPSPVSTPGLMDMDFEFQLARDDSEVVSSAGAGAGKRRRADTVASIGEVEKVWFSLSEPSWRDVKRGRFGEVGEVGEEVCGLGIDGAWGVRCADDLVVVDGGLEEVMV